MSSTTSDEMRIVKRDGSIEVVSFDKILRRIKNIGTIGSGTLDPIKINYTQLTMKIIDQLYDKISTTKIDELTADQCASMSSIHYDYGTLASRIIVSNCHKNTDADFGTVIKKLYNYKDKHGALAPLITRDLLDFAKLHAKVIKARIDYNRDFLFDYFGFKTLERSYLMRVNDVIVERPQHMWMRVALSIHKDDIDAALETYDLMSQKYFTHATPTLFNAGTPRPQLSSCFLIAMEEDSIAGIYNTLKDCALISKWAGGIGLHIHNVRASNSHIRGTNGSSNGIVPMLRVFNNTAKYVDQCLDPETIVYTKRGPVKIKNIIIGDEVITDDGNCYNIRKVLDYPEYKGDLHTIDVKHSLFPLKLTDMHPLWVIKNKKYVQTYFNDIIADLDKGLIAPDFIEAKNVDKNDFVGFPIPKWEQDIAQFTEDDCRMYGILIGDGNISRTNNLCYVSLNSETKQDIIEFVEAYLQMLGIHITYSHKHNNVRLVFSRNTMFKFTYEMVYDENKEKRILPNMLHLPKNKTLSIIKGILETDAKVSNHQISLEMTSFNVVESVRYMLLRLGILSSGSIRNRAGQTHVTVHGKTITNKKPTMTLLVPKKEIICKLFPNNNLECSKKLKFFEYKGYLFSIVNSNQKTENYSGRVIDIEVDNENHHNFLTHNGLVKNGGGKRNGSFAIYLEPWHADIELFLDMRKNHGDEELKARDLFYALWIPDLFMERVKTDGTWTLLCPDECPGLSDVYGDAFAELYAKYENDTTKTYKCRKTVKARDLWFKVLDAQMETGTPYLCYKDAANRKSNQSNLGTIKSSNLCVAPETLILTDKGHVEISSLENQKVNVWNGEEYSEVEVKKTGENQMLIEVKGRPNNRDDILTIKCTEYHKFYVFDVDNNIKMIECQELRVGTKLIGCKMPDGESSYDFIEIVSIEPLETPSDTFCFTEPKRNMGIFNGILTGQCSEIMEYSDENETAVCNLASIGLPTFISNGIFDYAKLHEVAQTVTRNLNKVIDINYYPTEKTRVSNMRHRPIGIGVQGLADVFMLLDVPFHSDKAKEINQTIFETIYHGALTASADAAEKDGPYETFHNGAKGGCPASKGLLQYDLWGVTPKYTNDMFDWSALKARIQQVGLRNSLLLAPMPTASTSQILGFNECFEPFTSNIYSRRTLAGEFVLTNKYLMRDLIDAGLWNTELKNSIVGNQGSVQHIEGLTQHLKDKYKTVWEIPMKHVIDMAADRGAFICQSQSLNLWLEDPNYNMLTSMHFYGWQKGLKTGIYYLRRRAKHRAQQFTIEPEQASNAPCEMCSS
jgi:ribonucleotide reductase alpha subunit